MTITVLYHFRYKKVFKPCTQLLRYKQPVPFLPVNVSMDNTILKKWSVSNASIYEKYFISDTRNFPNHVYYTSVKVGAQPVSLTTPMIFFLQLIVS